MTKKGTIKCIQLPKRSRGIRYLTLLPLMLSFFPVFHLSIQGSVVGHILFVFLFIGYGVVRFFEVIAFYFMDLRPFSNHVIQLDREGIVFKTVEKNRPIQYSEMKNVSVKLPKRYSLIELFVLYNLPYFDLEFEYNGRKHSFKILVYPSTQLNRLDKLFSEVFKG